MNTWFSAALLWFDFIESFIGSMQAIYSYNSMLFWTLTQWQSYDCPSASEVPARGVGKFDLQQNVNDDLIY